MACTLRPVGGVMDCDPPVAHDILLTTGDGESVRLATPMRDTGVGIPQEKREHIFQPFTQADSSATRKHGGTGRPFARSSLRS